MALGNAFKDAAFAFVHLVIDQPQKLFGNRLDVASAVVLFLVHRIPAVCRARRGIMA